MNRYQKTQSNGEWGENVARQIIETKFGKITFINDLIDFKSESGIYIEIKTCQDTIKSGNEKYPKRMGRYVLTKEQHTFLLIHDGYYVFLVKSGDLLMKTRIIQASKIRFCQVIQWKTIFDIPICEGC